MHIKMGKFWAITLAAALTFNSVPVSATEDLTEASTEYESEIITELEEESETESNTTDKAETESETESNTTDTIETESETENSTEVYSENKTETESETETETETETESLDSLPYCDGVEEFDLGLSDIWGGRTYSTYSINELGVSESDAKYDPRDSKYTLPIRDQHGSQSCWAHSVMASMEESIVRRYTDISADSINMSEKHLAYFSRNTGYDALGNDGGDTITPNSASSYYDKGGHSYLAAIRLMNWQGAASENNGSDYSITSNRENDLSWTPDKKEAQINTDYILKEMKFIPTRDYTSSDPDKLNTKLSVIKKAIVDYGYVDWSYYSNDKYLKNGKYIYTYDSNTSTTHAISIIGWDDTVSADNFKITYDGKTYKPAGNGAWIMRNSWGTDHGENGYYYISYYDLSLGSANAATVSVAGLRSEYDNNYFHGNTNCIPDSTIFGKKFAEVYTAKKEEEILKAVSFMIASDSSDYTLNIYVNGENKHSQTGKTDYAGVYTVDLDEDITLKKDDEFKIELVFNTSEAIRTDNRSGSDSASSSSNKTSKGESFRDGTDISASGCNNRINALTVNDNTARYNVYFYDSKSKTKLMDKQSVKQGESALVVDASKPGYTYKWKRVIDDTIVSDFSNITSDLEVYADYTIENYTITYHLNGGTQGANPENTYTVEDKVTLPVAQKEGYTFAGWCEEADCTDTPVTEILEGTTGNKTYYALFIQEVTVSISPYSTGVCSIDEGNTISITAVPVNAVIYYTTNGADPKTSGDVYTDEIEISKDMTVKAYAKYQSGSTQIHSDVVTQQYKYYKTSVELNQNTASIVNGKTLSLTVTQLPALDSGIAAVSWSSSNESVATVSQEGLVTAVGKGNATITASAKDHNNTIRTATCSITVTNPIYKVTFMGPDGKQLAERKVEQGEGTDYTPSVKGYKFEGWIGEEYKNVQSDVIVSGNFVAIEYDIKYELEGGTNSNMNPLKYTIESNIVLQPATRPGYIFDGWYTTSSKTGTPVTVIEAGNMNLITLYAKWTMSKGFDIRGNEDQVYTGKDIRLSKLLVYYDGTLLKEGTDYDAKYSNNINVGEAKVTITGKGRYTGSDKVYFNIKPADISKDNIKLTFANTTVKYAYRNKIPSVTVYYEGKTLKKGTHYTISGTPADSNVMITGKGNFTGSKSVAINLLGEGEKPVNISGVKVTLKKNGQKLGKDNKFIYTGSEQKASVDVTYKDKMLVSGTDYTLQYANCVNAGEATISVIGCGKYTGTKKITYTIGKASIKDFDNSFNVASVTYAKGGVKSPVKCSGKLVEGKDYSVEYAGHGRTGTASATIKARGNYSGSIKKTYTINPKSISDSTIDIIVPDIVKKSNTYKTTPILIDKENGRILTSGTDYSFKCSKDFGITITGKKNYQGTVNKQYKAVEAAKDISKATIKVTEKFYYDGTALTVSEIEKYVEVYSGKNELKNGTDYTIAAASGNPVYDKCTFILTGKGSYTGIKKFTITIKKRTLD